jgi:DNA-binding transcriptional ArsR family regulator
MAGRRTAAARAAQEPMGRPVTRAAEAPRPATDLDRLLHDRTRLAIISALGANASLSFAELKTMTETTDGNLSVHARRLEEGAYVTCTKSFDGRVPRTEFAITAAGRRALQAYLDHMDAIIRHARQKAR